MQNLENQQNFHYKQDLVGKVAIVTGASRGIGYAITRNLAKRGAAILATSTGAGKQIDELRDEVNLSYDGQQRLPPKIVHQALSLTDTVAHTKLTDAIQQHFDGQVDIFVNNAAITDRTYPGALEADTLDRLLMCNIRTPALMVDELVKRRYFRKGSRIIFISSAESVNCDPSVSIYASTKAANEAMVRCYANAFGGKNDASNFMAGTTANSVLTGLTETRGVQQYGPKVWQELQDFWLGKQTIPRLGQVDDVADVVGFLCSHESRWITGSKVNANGGSVALI